MKMSNEKKTINHSVVAEPDVGDDHVGMDERLVKIIMTDFFLFLSNPSHVLL